MGRTSGGLNTSQWIINDIHDFQRATPIQILIKMGKVCNQTMMRNELEGFGELWMVRFLLGFMMF